MTIGTPPTAPNPADPSTFNDRATAWVAWWASAIPEINALSGMTNSGQFLDGLQTAPGITFTADPDTGIYRATSNQMAFATAGVKRALISTTAFVIDVPITGTAVMSSDTDTTAGKLMPVGAFGLGEIAASPTLTAIDTTTTASGFYSYTTGATGTFPSGITAATGGTITVIRESATKGHMLLQPTGSTRLFLRNLNTTWGAWQQIAAFDASGAVTGGQVLRQNDAGSAAVWSDNITQSATVATGSGSSFDITGIPAWARRVTIMFYGVSLTGVEHLLVRLGTSGGVETTGYSAGSSSYNSGVITVTVSDGFPVFAGGASVVTTGHMTLTKMPGVNTWIESHAVYGAGPNASGGGSKILSGVLDRIRLTRSSGADTFDGGSVTVTWE